MFVINLKCLQDSISLEIYLTKMSPLHTIPFFLLLQLLPWQIDCLGGHASIKSQYGQLITSSTLRWTSLTKLQAKTSGFPDDAVQSGTGDKDNVVCRAEHHGMRVMGVTIENGNCAVGFVNKVYL